MIGMDEHDADKLDMVGDGNQSWLFLSIWMRGTGGNEVAEECKSATVCFCQLIPSMGVDA